MGLQNEMIMETLKKNSEEIARKKESGEKLSFKNWFLLICSIGLILCSIAFGLFIIKITLLIFK